MGWDGWDEMRGGRKGRNRNGTEQDQQHGPLSTLIRIRLTLLRVFILSLFGTVTITVTLITT
jgi:hypothetical protein